MWDYEIKTNLNILELNVKKVCNKLGVHEKIFGGPLLLFQMTDSY